MSPLLMYQMVALLLLAIGLYGIVWRNALVCIFIAVVLMLNGAVLSFVAASQLTEAGSAVGQIATLFVMGLAAAEATLVLAIIIVVAKRFKTVETDAITRLKG